MFVYIFLYLTSIPSRQGSTVQISRLWGTIGSVVNPQRELKTQLTTGGRSHCVACVLIAALT